MGYVRDTFKGFFSDAGFRWTDLRIFHRSAKFQFLRLQFFWVSSFALKELTDLAETMSSGSELLAYVYCACLGPG